MEIPKKQLSNGFTIPVLGLGTWGMGGSVFPNPFSDDAKDIASIQTALDMGITLIDTAELYAGGHAEKLIGKAIKSYDRSKLFLTTKVSPTNLSVNGVIKAAHNSLKRLETAYVDLYLIHAPNPFLPIAETMKALDGLLDEGLVKHVGVSNFSVKQLEAAQGASQHKLVVNQVHYNLVVREPERNGLLSYCQHNNVILEAYSPLKNGVLHLENSPVITEMMAKYDKTLAQIALNWLIAQPQVITIPKISHPQHLAENLGALGWEMEKEDVERLREELG